MLIAAGVRFLARRSLRLALLLGFLAGLMAAGPLAGGPASATAVPVAFLTVAAIDGDLDGDGDVDVDDRVLDDLAQLIALLQLVTPEEEDDLHVGIEEIAFTWHGRIIAPPPVPQPLPASFVTRLIRPPTALAV